MIICVSAFFPEPYARTPDGINFSLGPSRIIKITKHLQIVISRKDKKR